MKLLLLFAALVCIFASADSDTEERNHFWSDVKSQVKKYGHKFETLFLNKKEVVIEGDSGSPKVWAVLVAGSNGFYNYRHQADVCHAYQVLRKNGVPAENIITMMFDDIANHTENPTKGIIINEPNGENVYAGLVNDYTGEDVNPENFLKVLSGDAKGLKGVGSGRVLKSGPNDHVFINFVDHGAPGLLAFPSSELHARSLQDTLLDMYQKNQYGKLVMYIEACESGSMFEDLLPDNLNIFVTTASNPHEHSFACYYDEDRGTYLGDVYSVMWMQDSEKEDLMKETLFKQFSIVRKETTTSHVQEYGDLQIGKMKVAAFQSYGNRSIDPNNKNFVSPILDAVPSGDVPLEILRRQLNSVNSEKEISDVQRKIRHLQKKRQHLINTLKQITLMVTNDSVKTESIMTKRMKLTNFSCYEQLVNAFSKRCFNLSQNEYAYRQLFVLVNLCESSIHKEMILETMNTTCHPHHHPKYVGII